MLAATPLSRTGTGSGFEDAMNRMGELVSEDGIRVLMRKTLLGAVRKARDSGWDEDVIGGGGKGRVV